MFSTFSASCLVFEPCPTPGEAWRVCEVKLRQRPQRAASSDLELGLTPAAFVVDPIEPSAVEGEAPSESGFDVIEKTKQFIASVLGMSLRFFRAAHLEVLKCIEYGCD